MQDLINEFVLQLHKKKNISPNTEESYIRDVRKLFEYFEKENKKVVEGQFDMFNYKLGEIAHEIDKINLNELTPIDALNTLLKIKEKMK